MSRKNYPVQKKLWTSPFSISLISVLFEARDINFHISKFFEEISFFLDIDLAQIFSLFHLLSPKKENLTKFGIFEENLFSTKISLESSPGFWKKLRYLRVQNCPDS